MPARRREVLSLLVRALAWLPAFLVAWHFASPVLSWIPARLAIPVVEALSGPSNRLELSAGLARVELAIAPPYRPGARGGEALATIEVNPRLYTYGLALYLALSFAAPRPWRLAPIAAGSAVLVVLPAWGIAFDALKQLAASPELAPLLRWPAPGREAVAFGFQVGSLLMPTLAPVALWLWSNPALALAQPLRTLESSGS